MLVATNTILMRNKVLFLIRVGDGLLETLSSDFQTSIGKGSRQPDLTLKLTLL